MNVLDAVRESVLALSKRAPPDITPSTRLSEDLGLRSMHRVELAVMLEGKLGRAVNDMTVMRARTVGDLARSLETS
jgi:acyl carrier protein